MITDKVIAQQIKEAESTGLVTTVMVMHPQAWHELVSETRRLGGGMQFSDLTYRGKRVVRSLDVSEDEIIVL